MHYLSSFFLEQFIQFLKCKNCFLYQIGLFWFHLHKEANCIQFLISTISLCMIQISGEIVFFYIDSPDTIKCWQICTIFSCSTATDCCWWVLMTINPWAGSNKAFWTEFHSVAYKTDKALFIPILFLHF